MTFLSSGFKNTRQLLFLFLMLDVFSCLSQPVLFGERDLQENKIALYFDRYGNVYPNYSIPDSSLLSCSGNLAEWYKCNPKQFAAISDLYHCPAAEFNTENLNALQDSIVASVWKKINGETNQTVTFLIHGYRKSFRDIERGMSSVHEFNLLKRQLNNQQLKSNLYVEVYWDGTYNCCFGTNRKLNDSLFRQFELAQQYAPIIGLSLRKIMNGVQAEKINIIAHSLGSKIAVSSLFNLNFSNVETPDNRVVNICLIAPAISGVEIFEHYYDRMSAVNFSRQDNYRLFILYNEKDFVLRKKDNKIGLFGPGTTRYGNTSLGCNYKGELTRLERYFEEHFPASVIETQHLNSIGKNHSLGYFAYDDNLHCMVEFMNQ